MKIECLGATQTSSFANDYIPTLSWSSTVQTSTCALASDSFSENTQTFDEDGYSYSYDKNLLTLDGNTFWANAFSYNHGLLDIANVPRLSLKSLTFNENTESTLDSLNYYSIITAGSSTDAKLQDIFQSSNSYSSS